MTPSTDLRALAERRAAERDWPGAIAAFEELLSRTPDDADVLLQLSYLHSLAGRYRAAHELALRAHALRPTEPQVLGELIARLRTFNEGEALIECAERARPLSSVSIPLLLAFAAQLSYLNLPERAMPFLDEARRADPDYPPTLLSRAQVLTYLGRFEEAHADLDRCERRAPGLAKLYWLRSNLPGRRASDGAIATMEGMLRRSDLRPDDAAMVGFALHNELDRHGRHEQAWHALQAGCRAKRAVVSYQARETEALFGELRASLPTGRDDQGGSDSATVPIFITGMHRSGTTLLEQMLSAHPEVHATGELYDFTSALRDATDHHCRGVLDRVIVARANTVDLARVGATYLKGVRWRIEGRRFFTDKLPSNFLNIGYIARALPNARILHMVRDPRETCFSNLRELFSDANPYSYEMTELAHYYRQYSALMEHWRRSLPGRVLDVDYARLVREPEPVVRDVCAFVGLDFDPAMLDPRSSRRAVATASAVEVRQGIRARDVPKWKPYEAWLQPLIAGLGEAP